MAARQVATLVRWGGEIIGGTTQLTYNGGEVGGFFVSEGMNFTSLMDKMYDLSGLDRRIFTINIICRYGRRAEPVPIKNDMMTDWIFNPHNIIDNTVELYLEKIERRLLVDDSDERIGAYSAPSLSMPTQDFDVRVEECDASSSTKIRDVDVDRVPLENFENLGVNNEPEDDLDSGLEAEMAAALADAGDEDEDDDMGEAQGDLHVHPMHGNTGPHPARSNVGMVFEHGDNNDISSGDEMNIMRVNNNMPGVYTEPRHGGASLYLGQRFGNKVALLNAVKEYAVTNHCQHETGVSNPTQLTLKCIKSECPWHLRACIKKGRSYFEITRLVDPHTCVASNISGDHRQLDSNFICGIVREVVRAQIWTTPASIAAQIATRFGYNVSYCKAWKAKQKAMEQLFGNWEESYAMLPRYLEAVKHSNPGTVYEIESVALQLGIHQFKRVFWAFGPSIVAFQHCRNVLSIDGTHLYGKYKGTMLIANGVDGEGQILPVAFAIVESENRSSWTWFFDCMHNLVGLRYGLCVISDRHDGLVAVMKRPNWRPPRAYHRFCSRHLASNFNSSFKDTNLKELMYRAAMQKKVWKFDNIMSEIKNINPGARQWLDNISVEQWALAHDGGHRYGIMTTNLSESFNGVLKDARCLPIMALVQHTYAKLNKYFCDRRNTSIKYSDQFTPDVLLHIAKNYHKCGNFFVTIRNLQEALCEVRTMGNASRGSNGHSYKVNIHQRECTCNKWQLLEIPCSHAIAACQHLHLDHKSFIPNWCTVEAYRQTYATIVQPVPDYVYWPPHTGPKLIPDFTRQDIGCPRSVRLRNEMDEEERRERPRCSICGQIGHNRRNCQRRNG